jgi:sec-independent protein translocase protein TatB
VFNVTGGELFMILLVALIVLGPDRLPSAARRVGKMMGQLRDISEGFKREVAQALDDPSEPLVKPATRPKLTALDGGVAAQVSPEAPAAPSAPSVAAAGPSTSPVTTGNSGPATPTDTATPSDTAATTDTATPTDAAAITDTAATTTTAARTDEGARAGDARPSHGEGGEPVGS